MSRPNLFQLPSWERHEQRVIEIFLIALQKLLKCKSLPTIEDEINRKLLFLLRKSNYQLLKKDRGIEVPVTYESNNQPVSSDQIRVSRESKRPDFQWGLVDLINEKDLFFTIECKRLGYPSSTNWILNENYR